MPAKRKQSKDTDDAPADRSYRPNDEDFRKETERRARNDSHKFQRKYRCLRNQYSQLPEFGRLKYEEITHIVNDNYWPYQDDEGRQWVWFLPDHGFVRSREPLQPWTGYPARYRGNIDLCHPFDPDAPPQLCIPVNRVAEQTYAAPVQSSNYPAPSFPVLPETAGFAQPPLGEHQAAASLITPERSVSSNSLTELSQNQFQFQFKSQDSSPGALGLTRSSANENFDTLASYLSTYEPQANQQLTQNQIQEPNPGFQGFQRMESGVNNYMPSLIDLTNEPATSAYEAETQTRQSSSGASGLSDASAGGNEDLLGTYSTLSNGDSSQNIDLDAILADDKFDLDTYWNNAQLPSADSTFDNM